MLREQSHILTRAHQVLDLSLVALAFWFAYFIKKDFLPGPLGGLAPFTNYHFVLLLALVVYYLCFNFFGFYESFRRQTFDRIVLKIIKAVSTGFSITVLLLYLAKIQDFSRMLMGIFVIMSILLLIASKGLVYNLLVHYRQRGYNFRNVLIVGSKERAREMIEAIVQAPGAGYRLLGCLDIDAGRVGEIVAEDTKVIGTLADFRNIILTTTIDEIVFAMPLRKIDDARLYISFAEEVGVNVRILPDWQIQKVMYTPETASVYFDQFVGMPTIGLSSTPQKTADLLIKSFIDYAGAIVGLAFLAPLFLIFAIAIKISSPGPVFFKQERCGVNGRRFTLYKFRTMVAEAEQLKKELEAANEMDGPVFKMKEDPRITRVGKLLRKTSLDELPQLFNVLKGEMSLVGPRPPLPAEVEKYEVWQRRRLSMKPGLTCIWQVGGRNEVDFEKWMKMDLEYIDKWSLLLDLKLLLFTIKAVVLGTGK